MEFFGFLSWNLRDGKPRSLPAPTSPRTGASVELSRILIYYSSSQELVELLDPRHESADYLPGIGRSARLILIQHLSDFWFENGKQKATKLASLQAARMLLPRQPQQF